MHLPLTKALHFALTYLLIATASSAGFKLCAQSFRQSVSDLKVQDQQGGSPTLKSGTSLLREISGNEKHRYRINLTEHEYFHVSVDQRGIDLVLFLRGADDIPIIARNALSSNFGAEEMSWEVATSGWYMIEVQPKTLDAPRGQYQIDVIIHPNTSGEDQARISAERSMMEAVEAQEKGAPLEELAKSYTTVVERWQAVPDPKWVGQALNNLATTYLRMNQLEKSRAIFEQALGVRKDVGDKRGEADTLNNFGSLYLSLNEFGKAQVSFDQALKIREEMKDTKGIGITLNNLGLLAQKQGQFGSSIDYFEKSLTFSRASNNKPGRLSTLDTLAKLYYQVGQVEKARDAFNEELNVKGADGDLSGQSLILQNLGTVYEVLGQYDEAEKSYGLALKIRRNTNDREGQIWSLIGVANIARFRRQFGQAESVYNEALTLSREEKNPSYRSLEALILHNLGAVFYYQDQFDKARQYYEQALPLRVELKDKASQAWTLTALGDICRKLKQYTAANDYFNKALTIHREVKDKGGEAWTLFGVALVAYNQANYSSAHETLQLALDIIEHERVKRISQQLRTSYSASTQQFFELNIHVLMALDKEQPNHGFDAKAFELSERSRARSLLELLSEAQIDIRKGVDAELLHQEETIGKQLDEKAAIQTRLLLAPGVPEAQKVQIKDEVASLLSQYQAVEAKIRDGSPNYSRLTQPSSTSLKEIQKRVLDPEAVLLEYYLSDDQYSYVWAVTKDSIKSFRLRTRSEIEDAARRVYRLLTSRSRHEPFETDQKKKERVARDDAEYPKAAAALSEMILKPVAKELGHKQLLIVADGALQYIPFAALPVPESHDGPLKRSKQLAQTPLIVDHKIVNLPSASVLAAVREELSERKKAPETIVVLADPVFDKDDQRLEQSTSRQSTNKSTIDCQPLPNIAKTLSRAMGKEASDNKTVIPRLPCTRREAEAIMSIASSRHSKQLLDFDASKSNVTRGHLDNYQIVHFATHGWLDDENPDLSAIVLSLVDQTGMTTDGFLRLRDIYNLNLPAELVVLSSCESALGKDVRGEGIIGLTRGFMYAGAKRLVVSLWEINDVATAELMKRFYELKRHLPASEALRAAQKSMLTQRRWSAPYFWAGLTFQGEPY